MPHEAKTKPKFSVSPGLRRTIGGASLSAANVPVSSPNQFKGGLGERMGIGRSLAYLQRVDSLRQGSSWADLLAGNTPLSHGGVQLNTHRCIKAAGYNNDTSVLSFGGAVEGPDYKALKRDHPQNRYKFYHSIQDAAGGERYLTEFIQRAGERKLSVALKTFDHTYDSVNIYTHYPREVSALITELYPRYKAAFLKTEHFLQGTVNQVDPRHVGWVQEPGQGLGSHSTRMGELGKALDVQGLNEEAYRAGCDAAGVLPASPWLLNEASLQMVGEY